MSKLCTAVLCGLFLGWTSQALAAESDAYQFATHVGVIGGIAQACGKDVSVLVARSQEAIAIIAVDTNDATLALSNLQKTMITQYNAQKANHALPCDQIASDYDNLPLLKDDYKTEVLPKLVKTKSGQATTVSTANTILPQTVTVVPGSLDTSKGPAATMGSATNGQGSVTNIYIAPPSPTTASASPQVSVSSNNNNQTTPQINAVYGAPIINNNDAGPKSNPFANPALSTPNSYTSASPNPLATATPNPYAASTPNPLAAATPNPYVSSAPSTATSSSNALPQQGINTFAQVTPTQEYQQSITR